MNSELKKIKNIADLICNECPNKDKFKPTFKVQKTNVNGIDNLYYCDQVRNHLIRNGFEVVNLKEYK